MEFNVEELRAYFLTRIIGRRIEYYEELESTNTEALRLALENAPEGTVVIADAQSEGRGRLDRIWESPPSLNLYLSVVLRPDITAAASSIIPLMVGIMMFIHRQYTHSTKELEVRPDGEFEFTLKRGWNRFS
ncbi:MAG: hypothetical protein HGA73_03505 [Syntrophaceae bacterium]|nr:hypothetical protein [Syntrophaceae bacterium]